MYGFEGLGGVLWVRADVEIVAMKSAHNLEVCIRMVFIVSASAHINSNVDVYFRQVPRWSSSRSVDDISQDDCFLCFSTTNCSLM